MNGVTLVRVVKQASVLSVAVVRNGASKKRLVLTWSWYSDAVGTGVQLNVGRPASGPTAVPSAGVSGAAWSPHPREKVPLVDQRPCPAAPTAATRHT